MGGHRTPSVNLSGPTIKLVAEGELDNLRGSGDAMAANAEVCAAQIKEGLDNS